MKPLGKVKEKLALIVWMIRYIASWLSELKIGKNSLDCWKSFVNLDLFAFILCIIKSMFSSYSALCCYLKF